MPDQSNARSGPDEWDLEFLPWMEGLHYTMGVYDWGVTKITKEEQLITEVLDDLLDKQLNDPTQIKKFVAEAKNSSSTLINGRVQKTGECQLNSHLAPIMLLQMLRIYLSSTPKAENSLSAFSHPQLSRVLDAIQMRYQEDWSLDGFAELANMSRSGFALTFRRKMGVSPMVYLLNWRMQIACELLQTGDQPLSAVARAVGFGSESAFSAAFYKTIKQRPGEYRRGVELRKNKDAGH